MDKDRSKKKGGTLWKRVKINAAKQFQYWKPKTQGKESCKIIIMTFMFCVDVLGH